MSSLTASKPDNSLPDLLRLNTLLRRSSGDALNPCGSEWILLTSGEPRKRALLVGARRAASVRFIKQRYQDIEVVQLDSETTSSFNNRLKILDVDMEARHLTIEQLEEHLLSHSKALDLVVLDACLVEMFGQDIARLEAFLKIVSGSLNIQGQCCLISPIQPTIAGIASGTKESFNYTLHDLQGAMKCFSDSRTFFLYPEICEPNEIVGWNNALPERKTNFATRMLNRFGLIAPMHRAVAMIGGSKSQAPFLHSVVQHACRHAQLSQDLVIQNCLTRFNGTVIAMVKTAPKSDGSASESSAVIRMPLFRTAGARLEHAWQGVEQMRRELPWLTSLTPTSLARGEYLGIQYYLESLCRGVSAETLVKEPSAREQVHEVIVDFLQQFGRVPDEVEPFSDADFAQHVTPDFELLREYLPHYEREITHLYQQISSKLLGVTLPLVRVHGDFNSGNVLCDASSNKITGLIDWDACQSRGLPLQDLAHFLIHRYRHDRQITMGDALLSAISEELFDSPDLALIKRYQQEMNINDSLRIPLLILYWLRHVSLHIAHRNGPLPKGWQESNLHVPLKHLGSLTL